jgi:predicted outer membrane repeat protein
VFRKFFRFLRTSVSDRSGAGRRPRSRPVPELLEGRLAPAVLTVDGPADDTTPDNVLTLREAIAVVDGTLGRSLTAAEQAHLSGTLGSHDAIQFALPAGPQTVTLTLGALAITNGVTITGPGATNLTIDGNGLDRVFVVGKVFTQDLGLNVSLSGLTVTGGSAAFGGGLLNFGTLALTDCVVRNNAATANGGGGLYNDGALTLTGCTFNGNTTHGPGATAGGGLDNISAGTVSASDCTFADNTATRSGPAVGSGAGLANSGAMTISGSTFSGNSAASDGGAIYNDGALTVSTTTFSGNSAGSDGGAIRSGGISLAVSASTFNGNTAESVGGALDTTDATATLTNCTLVGNTAGSLGGAVEAEVTGGAVTLTNVTVTANRVTAGSSGRFGGGLSAERPITLDNTLVAGNVQGPAGSTASDVSGTLDPGSAYNLIGTGGAGGLADGTNHNRVGVADPGLGALADNGGPTQTVLPLPGSPALGAGSTAYVTAGETDQRGLPRVVNGAVDVGAVEVQAPPSVTPSRGISARLVARKVRKKRRLLVEVFSADTGALRSEFVSPFQRPRYRAIEVSVRDSNSDGVPDQVVLTARKGKRTVTAFLAS